ncbi:hypothetical protein TNCV_4676141 [Trichonephila clavipes]|nr:hypothetical protein TNCV_4676141 [Trichonephila clavipes]
MPDHCQWRQFQKRNIFKGVVIGVGLPIIISRLIFIYFQYDLVATAVAERIVTRTCVRLRGAVAARAISACMERRQPASGCGLASTFFHHIAVCARDPFKPATSVQHHNMRQHGIMILGVIAYNRVLRFLVHSQGTMNIYIQRYINHKLQPVTLTFQNIQPTPARICQRALQNEGQRIPWSPLFPDLSAVKCVWDVFENYLHALPQPRSQINCGK